LRDRIKYQRKGRLLAHTSPVKLWLKLRTCLAQLHSPFLWTYSGNHRWDKLNQLQSAGATEHKGRDSKSQRSGGPGFMLVRCS